MYVLNQCCQAAGVCFLAFFRSFPAQMYNCLTIEVIYRKQPSALQCRVFQKQRLRTIKQLDMSIPELREDGHSSNPNPSPENEKARDKNKGGRPKGRDYYCNHKVHIYLTDEEYDLLVAYIKSRSPYDHNVSRAGRQLLESALREWDKKGRKPR